MDGITDPRWAAFRPGRFSPGLADPVGAAAALSHLTRTFDPNKEPA
jgi:glycine oxidase